MLHKISCYLEPCYNSIWLYSVLRSYCLQSWWCHQMETFSTLLAIYAGNSLASGEFRTQRPVMRSFDIFFDLCLNKRLSKQSWGWWFETLSCPLWHHCNASQYSSLPVRVRYEVSFASLNSYWCAILIAHQLLWQNMGAPVSIFLESPLTGEPRERLFHIHSVHRYQLSTKYLYPSTLLWQINGCNV